MSTAKLQQEFSGMTLPERADAAKYNFQHFRTKHLLADTLRVIRTAGVRPGEAAPDFTLPKVGGGTVSLSELRGTPVLVHFGSLT